MLESEEEEKKPKESEPFLRQTQGQETRVNFPWLWGVLLLVPILFSFINFLFSQAKKETVVQNTEPSSYSQAQLFQNETRPITMRGNERNFEADMLRARQEETKKPGSSIYPLLSQEQIKKCDFSSWVGYAFNDQAVAVLNKQYRVIKPDMTFTFDYIEDRLNFDINYDGIIIRVWCG